MKLGIVGQAVGLFAVTNVDDILVLGLFFTQGNGRPHRDRRGPRVRRCRAAATAPGTMTWHRDTEVRT